jgi:outer membrane biosynthesis protein TonB
MPHDESHVQTQPLRVERVPGKTRDKIVVESLLQKPASKSVEPAERLIGRRYRLKERLRRRRLGIVFAAVDELGWLEGEERRVAIQFLDAKLAAGDDFGDRFERGVAALQALEHRGLVSTFDAGRDGSRWFLVLEMPDSGTLRYVLDDVRQLPPTEAGAVVRAIGDALEYLHARSIVHGNLKLENVLVTFDFDVKLLDVVPPDWPLTPPAVQDVRDDVYGLACLAYEMLTGRHPFDGNSPREALRNGLRPEPVPRLPPKQWRALVGALELEPAQRTPTVRQFLEEFGVIATAGLRALVAGDIAGAPPVEKPAPWIGGGDVVMAERAARYEARRSSIGGKLLLLFLAALAALAWKYQDTIRDEATAFVATVNSWVPATPPQEAAPAADTTTPAAPVEEDPIARVTAAPDGSATVTSAPVETPPDPAEPPPDPGEALPNPAKPPPVPAKSETPPAREQAAAAPAPAPAAETPPPGPVRFSFASPAMRVAESEVAARVLIRRSGDQSGSAAIAWWTAPGTAASEQDFANLGRRVETFKPGERQRTVFVPLTNDKDAESGEYFNVFIGDVRGGVSPQAGMRVEIADDD